MYSFKVVKGKPIWSKNPNDCLSILQTWDSVMKIAPVNRFYLIKEVC